MGAEKILNEQDYLSKLVKQENLSKWFEKYALHQLNESKSKHQKSGYLHSTSFKTAEYLTDKFIVQTKKQNFKLKNEFSKSIQRHEHPLSNLWTISWNPISYFTMSANCIEPQLNQWKQSTWKIAEQLRIVNVYERIVNLRKKILEEMENDLQSWKSKLADACGSGRNAAVTVV